MACTLVIKQFGMNASMSRKADCYDNATMEGFWGSLKNELVHHGRFATREEARKAITEYIEIFYNRQRKQARCDSTAREARWVRVSMG